MKYVKGFLIQATNGNAVGEVTFPNNLNSIYEVCDCQLVDIVRVNIGGKLYDVYIDDEWLFRDQPKITGKSINSDQELFGNLLVVRHKAGNVDTLTDEDIQLISQEVKKVLVFPTMEIKNVLMYKNSNR